MGKKALFPIPKPLLAYPLKHDTFCQPPSPQPPLCPTSSPLKSGLFYSCPN